MPLTMSSLTRGEYWLLETVVLHGCRLSLIFAETFGPNGHEGVVFEFNKPSHGLDSGELLSTLLRMQAAGWIAFKENLDAIDDDRVIHCSQEDLIAALKEYCRPATSPRWLSYQLTPSGGAIWEQFAAADWSYFVTVWLHSQSETPAESIRVTALTQKRLEEALPLLRPPSKILGRVSGYQFPDDETLLAWEAISPWQATYWKQFPAAQTVWWPVSESWLEHQIMAYPLSGEYPLDFKNRWYRWR